jgi:hypothetical protein
MVEFTRQKSLNQTYKRLVLNENDLVRIATIVHTLVEKYEYEMEIKIISGDGQETIRTSDPNFFTSSHMFPQIRSVSIVYHHYDAPVSCRVDISSNVDGKASVSVDGIDRETVSGIFHELEREFKLRQSLGAKFYEHLNSGFTSLLISVVASALTAVAIYSVFDLLINFITSRSIDFNGSQLKEILQTVGWISVFGGAVAGGIYIIDLLKQALPGVEFSGRLSDTNAVNKSKIIWVFSIILLPIVINVLSNLITSAIGVK